MVTAMMLSTRVVDVVNIFAMILRRTEMMVAMMMVVLMFSRITG